MHGVSKNCDKSRMLPKIQGVQSSMTIFFIIFWFLIWQHCSIHSCTRWFKGTANFKWPSSWRGGYLIHKETGSINKNMDIYNSFLIRQSYRGDRWELDMPLYQCRVTCKYGYIPPKIKDDLYNIVVVCGAPCGGKLR